MVAPHGRVLRHIAAVGAHGRGVLGFGEMGGGRNQVKDSLRLVGRRVNGDASERASRWHFRKELSPERHRDDRGARHDSGPIRAPGAVRAAPQGGVDRRDDEEEDGDPDDLRGRHDASPGTGGATSRAANAGRRARNHAAK